MANRQQVVDLYQKGFTNKEIAQRLGVHHSTVSAHLRNGGIKTRHSTRIVDSSLVAVQKMVQDDLNEEAYEEHQRRYSIDACPICKRMETGGELCWTCSIVTRKSG